MCVHRSRLLVFARLPGMRVCTHCQYSMGGGVCVCARVCACTSREQLCTSLNLGLWPWGCPRPPSQGWDPGVCCPRSWGTCRDPHQGDCHQGPCSQTAGACVARASGKGKGRPKRVSGPCLPPTPGEPPALNPLPRLLVPSSGSSWSDNGPSPRLPAPAFSGSSPGTLGDGMEGTAATAPLSPTIKAGWLDKNPPQG